MATTSSTVTSLAWLVQLLRMKFTTSAMSASARVSNAGMEKAMRSCDVSGMRPPLRVICSTESG